MTLSIPMKNKTEKQRGTVSLLNVMGCSELKDRMKRHPRVNWTAFIRQCLENAVEQLEQQESSETSS